MLVRETPRTYAVGKAFLGMSYAFMQTRLDGAEDVKPDLLYGTVFLVLAVGLAYRAVQSGFWLLLLWPCLSFCLVSLAYFSGVVDVFGKREDGTRARVRGILLLPYLLFAWVVWELQTRISREPPWHTVDESLIVSR